MHPVRQKFDRPASVTVATIIDNIRFTGDDRAELIAAAKIFVERCAVVGAQLNDPEKSVEQRVTENDDFSGENYDYKAKTRRLTAKTLTKVSAVELNGVSREVFTYRRYAAASAPSAFSNHSAPCMLLAVVRLRLVTCVIAASLLACVITA